MRLEKADRETDSALSKEAQIKQQNDNINKKKTVLRQQIIYTQYHTQRLEKKN